MSIKKQLSYSLGLKTQKGNRDLAEKIATSGNYDELNEICQFIESKPLERLQMDAMLTLAYIAEYNPKMMKDRVDFLLSRLNDPINRVVFGSMIALAHLAHLRPSKLYQSLPIILDAMAHGSVVSKDHGFRILIILYGEKEYSEDVFLIILEQLFIAPPNQLGQYTERLMAKVSKHHKKQFIAALEKRAVDLTNESHQKRISKNLKKLYND